MLTRGQANRLTALIRRYTSAKVESSWTGGMLPDSRAQVAENLRRTRIQLKGYIIKLQKGESNG